MHNYIRLLYKICTSYYNYLSYLSSPNEIKNYKLQRPSNIDSRYDKETTTDRQYYINKHIRQKVFKIINSINGGPDLKKIFKDNKR